MRTEVQKELELSYKQVFKVLRHFRNIGNNLAFNQLKSYMIANKMILKECADYYVFDKQQMLHNENTEVIHSARLYKQPKRKKTASGAGKAVVDSIVRRVERAPWE